jgi:hypothetical protein
MMSKHNIIILLIYEFIMTSMQYHALGGSHPSVLMLKLYYKNVFYDL